MLTAVGLMAVSSLSLCTVKVFWDLVSCFSFAPPGFMTYFPVILSFTSLFSAQLLVSETTCAHGETHLMFSWNVSHFMLLHLKSDMVSVYFYINILECSGLLFILLPLVFYTLIANQFFLIAFFYFDVYSGFSIAMEELKDAKLFLHCIF